MLRFTVGISLAVLLTALGVSTLAAQDIQVKRINEAIVTVGTIDVTGWSDQAWTTILDFSTYNSWAIKGIDGMDPVSKNYWEHFKQWRYTAPDKMVLIYDVNLGWPFGSKGNEARFKLDLKQFAAGKVRFDMYDRPFLLNSAYLELTRETIGSNRQLLRITLSLELIPLVMVFMDVESYKVHMNEVMTTLVTNLISYVKSRPPKEAAKP